MCCYPDDYFLFQRLLVNTQGDHPDYILLKEVETTLHNFAKKIGQLSEHQVEDGQQETLKKLEMLLITDVSDICHDVLYIAVNEREEVLTMHLHQRR